MQQKLILVFLSALVLSSCSLFLPRPVVWEYFSFDEHPLTFKVPTTKSWEKDIGNACGRRECRYIARDHELGIELHLIEFKNFPIDPQAALEKLSKRYSLRKKNSVLWSSKVMTKDGEQTLYQTATQGLWAGRPWNMLVKSWIYDNANHLVVLMYKGRLNQLRMSLFSEMIGLSNPPVNKLVLNKSL